MKKELTAGLIIEGKRVLLVHNVKHGTLRIEPPGGKRHAGETREGSIIREIWEELGIKVEPLRFFGSYDTRSPEGDFKVYMYICGIIEGEPFIKEPGKIPGFGWYTLEEIEGFRKKGILVENMVEAYDELKKILD